MDSLLDGYVVYNSQKQPILKTFNEDTEMSCWAGYLTNFGSEENLKRLIRKHKRQGYKVQRVEVKVTSMFNL